jgi:hypothetical protein
LEHEECHWCFRKQTLLFKGKTYNFVAKREEEIGTLLHKRIDHPSDKILKCIFDFKILDCSNCEMCKLGKHTKLPFSISKCKSKIFF